MIVKIVKIYLGLSLVLLYCGFSSFLASSLVLLIFLKIYRPLPMQSVVTTGSDLLPVASKAFPSVISSSVCWSLQCLASALTQRGWWGNLFFFFQAHLFSRTPFEELGCFSGCLMSSASIQQLFCGIYSMFKCSFDEFVGEKVFSPSYSSAILAPPPTCFLVIQLLKRLSACNLIWSFYTL